jgi:RimJ/RimL family protein N-acetyltransferase
MLNKKNKKSAGITKKIIGERIYLRPLKISDASRRYCRWLNDEEVNRYLETKSATIAGLKKYIAKKIASPNCFFVGIFDKKKKKHIGNIKLEPIDWERKGTEYGIVIGEKNYWGKGFGEEATRLIIDYAFNQLGLNEMYLGVIPQNKNAVELYKRLGFKTTGVKKDAFYYKGKTFDHIRMVLIKK